ncbi:hypothetical protein WKV44_07785 [Spirochaetia bacterium 38H-sp]|uniref:Uncharacterized protein n=1 Tax=Rarispira pelagica TaxID=3141764 RepID=A0ABU9UCP6_9SPIR
MAKKIACIGILVLLVATLGFSADLKVKLQARASSELFKNVDGEPTEMMGLGDISRTDSLTFEFKDENAGAYAQLYLYSLTDSKTTAPYIYDYYGWMKFGDLKLTAGNWDNRYANRVTKDGSNFGQLWDLKYGPIKYSSGKEAGVNLDTESDHLNPWYITTVADYSISDFTLSLSTGNGTTADSNGYDYTDYDIRDYFGVRAAYNKDGLIKTNTTFIMNGENNARLGVFVEPLMVDNLTLVVGYSGKLDLAADSTDSLSAIELRARYAIDKLAITSHNNVTIGDRDLRIYNMVNVAYEINDMIKPCLLIANGNFSGDNASTKTNVTTIKPGVTFTAQSNATIDVALRVDIETPDGGESTTTISMPVVFRVKFSN